MIRMEVSAHLNLCTSPETAQTENSMPRQNGFENKKVVIVGGSSGIGLAVAEEVASQGAEVVIVSSNAERVQEAIQSIGGKARGQIVDVSEEKAVESFFADLGT